MNDERFEALVGYVFALERWEEDLARQVGAYESNVVEAEGRANVRVSPSLRELEKLRAEGDATRYLAGEGLEHAEALLEGIQRCRREALDELAGRGPSGTGAPRGVWVLRGPAHAVLIEGAGCAEADGATQAPVRLRRALREVVERAPDGLAPERVEGFSRQVEAYRRRSPVGRFFRGRFTLEVSERVFTPPVLAAAVLLLALLTALGPPIGVLLPAVYLVYVAALGVSERLVRAYEPPPLYGALRRSNTTACDEEDFDDEDFDYYYEDFDDEDFDDAYPEEILTERRRD